MAPRTIRYATTRDGLEIAYQVLGDGPIDIVWVNGFLSNLDLNDDLTVFERHARHQTRFARILSFDKRGSGLSERGMGSGTLEDRMDDIRACMDAAGFDFAVLQAGADGGPIALAFAATYPERVRALVLNGAWARLSRAPGYDVGISPEVADAFLASIDDQWGTGEVSAAIANIEDPTPADLERLAVLERSQGPPRSIRPLLELDMQMDARDVLPLITAPTLVLQHEDHPVLGDGLGRYLVDHIEGAQYVALHSLWDSEEAANVVEEFLTGNPATPSDADRVLATCLFTDVVGSTEHASRVGDAAWRDLLDRHNAAVRHQLDRFGGHEVDTAGDGFFATFDGPARAIRCARATCGAIEPLGLRIRAGIHTGEVTHRGDEYSGLAVHIGARVGALAGPSEVLVTQTVRDLVVGSGIEFDDRGLHQLKGIDGEWRVLAVIAA